MLGKWVESSALGAFLMAECELGWTRHGRLLLKFTVQTEKWRSSEMVLCTTKTALSVNQKKKNPGTKWNSFFFYDRNIPVCMFFTKLGLSWGDGSVPGKGTGCPVLSSGRRVKFWTVNVILSLGYLSKIHSLRLSLSVSLKGVALRQTQSRSLSLRPPSSVRLLIWY